MRPTKLLISIVVVLLIAQVADAQLFKRRRPQRPPTIRTTIRTAVRVPQEARLVELIKKYQDRYVGKSFGEEAYQCVTEIDLQRIRRQIASGEIAEELGADKNFLKLADEIRSLTVAQRNQVFARGQRTYRQTWRERGGISSAGQTVAGQKGEREVANHIVGLVKKNRVVIPSPLPIPIPIPKSP